MSVRLPEFPSDAAVVVQRQLSVHFHPAHFAVLGEQAGFVPAVVEFAFKQLKKNVAELLAVVVVNVFQEQCAQRLPSLRNP